MEYKVILTDTASDDLLSAVRHIAQFNYTAAIKFHDETIKSLQRLSKDPHIAPEAANRRLKTLGYRKLVLDNYIAWYKVDDKSRHVKIIRFLHGAMKQEKHL